MRMTGGLVALGVCLAIGVAFVQAQEAPVPNPNIREIEMIWREYWGHIAQGDYASARKYVHPDHHEDRLQNFPPREIEQRKLMAQFLLLCRPEPPVVRVSVDVIGFSVRCPRTRAGEEDIAQPGSRMRLDADGKWKFSGL